MTTVETFQAPAQSPAREAIGTRVYRVVGYFGLVSVMASLAYGFRFNAEAPTANYLFDLGLYALFIAPHLLFTRGWWKNRVWGNPAGSLRERQFYISFTIVTWLGLLWIHRPVPGFWIDLPEEVRFAGLVGFLWCVLLFFEGATRAALDGLLGVPGSEMQFSHGDETPLYTDGPYAQVRHPMYRAATLMALCSLMMHPNAAQLLWAALTTATFMAFIPVEESQLLAARGDDYRRYRQRTPYRLFRGIW